MIYKMKLWQKICISSLIASILLFAVCGIITTVSGHKRNLQAEENQAVWLAGQMKAEVERAYREHKDLTAPFLNPLIPEDVCFQVYQGETRLYDGFGREPETPRYDFGYEIAREPLELVTIQKVNYLFAEETLDLEGGAVESAVNGKAAPGAVAAVAGSEPAGKAIPGASAAAAKTEPARLVLVKDLSDVYARCNAQLQTLFLLCGILSAVSALIMVTASLIITVPIKKINEAVKIVSDDYYAYRLPVTGTDELNELSANFNVMCEAIENNIRNYKFAIDNFIHEVKTPLTSIVNYVDLLKKEDIDNPKAQEYLEVLDRQSKRLKKLTEDLVEASKASSGVIPVDCQPTNVNVLLSQLEGEYEERLQKAELTMIVHPAAGDPVVLADGKLLSRVMDNLMNNIGKYAMPGTRVYAAAAADEKESTISIKNVSRNELNVSADELMERFVRGDSSRHTEGSGLGLSIAKSLVELQGGRFELSIDGDLFRADISLPLYRPQ